MKRSHAGASWLSYVLCFLALCSMVTAQAPAVQKIDPPNWWLNFTPDVTLLLTGENLKGAHVESKSADASVVGSQGSANGHYLFVHLRLKTQLRSQFKTRIKTKLGSPAAKGAKISLRVVTAGGAATLQFPTLPRDETRGDFEGFDRDDVSP